ncbi:MAG TPA: cysteine hydrolase [Verrucomicrobia bacterium]|nr:MAG: isochorismatase [Lentisphaerae bacterium GWF2_57_35]HBA85973.1 cysteine hydrolase [Verrucomicrobiota bacterium]
MKSGLLLIDIQNDYFTGGAMPLEGMETSALNAAALLQRFRDHHRPIYHIQHMAVRPGASFFLPETRGMEIHSCVMPLPPEQVFIKHYPNSFRETMLAECLGDDSIEHLVIGGAMSHMCVDATVRAAFDMGFKCTVVEDACATRDLEFNGQKVAAQSVHAAFMAALATPYAEVLSIKQYVHRYEPAPEAS